MLARPARRLALGLSLSLALAWTRSALADGDQVPDEPPPPPVTTEVWREPAPPVDLHWHLLALPEYAVELAFTPVALLVGLVEEYRIDQRVYDFISEYNFVPSFKAGFGDGAGFGGEFSFDLGDEDHELEFGGMARGNGDFELGAEYEQRFAWAEGRLLHVEFLFERDSDLPFYGIGNDTDVNQRRALADDYYDLFASFDLTPLGQLDSTGVITVGWRRDELEPGEDPAHPPVTDDPMDPVGVPAGFRQGLDYPYVRIDFLIDSRDNVGTPTVGTLADVWVGLTRSIDDDRNLSAISFGANYRRFFPVLPQQRVIVLEAGAAAAIPTSEDHEVPFHELIVLGRESHLRGYNKTRFRDELGWWASAEYRWQIWEYPLESISLTPLVFLDAGRVAGDLTDLVKTPIRYSYGLGLRGAHETALIFELGLGFSPEGRELGFSLGAEL